MGSERSDAKTEGSHRAVSAFLRRTIDILSSLAVIVTCSPLFVAIAIIVKLTSVGPVFFRQERCGLRKRPFRLYKFRTMYQRSEPDSKLTVAADKRVTGTGKFLRATKLDELPQFLNVLRGEMRIIGPRPEVNEIVERYEPWMEEIFLYKPGLADAATFACHDEPEILAASDDPDETYLRDVLPRKIGASLEYQRNRTILTDFRLIFRIIIWMLTGRPKPIAKF